jgi:hypothetical protein
MRLAYAACEKELASAVLGLAYLFLAASACGGAGALCSPLLANGNCLVGFAGKVGWAFCLRAMTLVHVHDCSRRIKSMVVKAGKIAPLENWGHSRIMCAFFVFFAAVLVPPQALTG